MRREAELECLERKCEILQASNVEYKKLAVQLNKKLEKSIKNCNLWRERSSEYHWQQIAQENEINRLKKRLENLERGK